MANREDIQAGSAAPGLEEIGLNAPADRPEEPASFAFDAESLQVIERTLKRYPPSRKASAVIPLLYVVQNQMRRQTGSAWVPRVAMDEVPRVLEMPPIRVYEVATFYFMFNMAPIGRYHLQVC